MNKENETNQTEELVTPEGYVLRRRPRPATDVSIRMPLDTLASIDRVAAHRGMSRAALLRYYIGHELRIDLDQLYLLETTKPAEQELPKQPGSEEAAVAA